MGVSRIGYRPWKGKRTDPNQRLLVISKHVLNKNIRAKSVIVLLIFGMMLAHAFPIIGALITPHEEVTREDMVGSEDRTVVDERPDPEHVIIGDLQVSLDLRINGTFLVNGTVHIDGDLILSGGVQGTGSIGGYGITFQNGDLTTNGSVSIVGQLSLNGSIQGSGTISGSGGMTGNGSVHDDEGPEEEVPEFMGGGGYLTSGLFIIFAMLLAAIVCADIIAQDLADSSFVLYFSRPVRTIDYLVGKFIGLSWVMGIFCLIPPILYVLVMMGTQTGDDYGGGMRMLGLTVVAGIVTSLYFLPYGLMLSSFTKNKAYAGIGIFMSFFVLSIISELFSESSAKWLLIDPFQVLAGFYRVLFGGELADGISSWEVAASMLAITVIPAIFTYIWVSRKEAGR